MSATAAHQQTAADMMQEIRELAATRRHRLAPHMTGGRSLTPPQAERVLEHLRGCAPLDPAPPCEAEAEPSQKPVPPPLSAYKGKIGAGYYATRRPDGTIDFWKIDVPDKGKWAGYAFPRRVLGGDAQAGEEMRTVDLENMQKRQALQAILTFGLDEAGTLFAEQLTRCRDCGRFLTDEESRAASRGPICRAKH